MSTESISITPFVRVVLITILVSSLINISALCQTEINQKTSNGQKIGKWVDFYNNGKINAICYYKPTQKIETLEEAFFKQKNQRDTLYSQILIRKEVYIYNNKWELLKVRVNDSIGMYGINQEIEVQDSFLLGIDHTGNKKTLSIEIKNNSKEEIILTRSCMSKNLTFYHDKIIIPPEKKGFLNIEIMLKSGENQDVVKLFNDSISINIKINSFGYDLTSDDFKSEQMIKLKRHFVYLRTDDEALLKIYKDKKDKELKTFSLAYTKTEIAMDDISVGEYWFCIFDFGSNEQKWCKVYIKE